jgi:hypothetical protein
MNLKAYAGLLALQSGVVSRRQLIADAGLQQHDLQRLVRRRDLVRVHDGVFLNHTGEPTWLQRAWIGVHLVWPAALAGDSALRAAEGPGRSGRDESVIQLAVDRDRHAVVPTGYRLHRMSSFHDRVMWNTSPPRVRIEEALIDVAIRKPDDFSAVAALADAIQGRLTQAVRIRAALDARPRLPRRTFLTGVLRDLERGTCSVLEHGYLTRVEQAHGLPAAQRQVRDSRHGPLYRDVVYEQFDQLVELDGRMWHDSANQHDADLDRDLDAAVERLATVRLGWGQVYGRPCETAVRIGRLLSARGWLGRPTRCPECPDSVSLAG